MSAALPLFAAFGIEIEYAIVDRASLDVRPLADSILRNDAGELTDELVRGGIGWSNELAAHVLELKTCAPAAELAAAATAFAAEVAEANRRLAAHGARLLPSAMHPWMDPLREFALWPHGNREIYAAFNRIFGCQGHGWSNLQSVHVNLPFAGDEELARLHAAVRVLLPLLPAIAASSPFVEGGATGFLDTRLEVYRENARRVPAMTGAVVPEPVATRAQYESEILGRLYAELLPLDPEGVLHHEWANARGVIARFERSALEIRVLDTQECPAADCAVAFAVVEVLRALVARAEPEQLDRIPTESLAALLRDTGRAGGAAEIANAALRDVLALPPSARSAGAAWEALIARDVATAKGAGAHLPALLTILREGPLAARLLRAAGAAPARESLHAVYGQLADCLAENRCFHAT